MSYLHLIGYTRLLSCAENWDGVQREMPCSCWYAGVAEEEEAVTAEWNEVDARVGWQAYSSCAGARKDYCACIGKESRHARR